MEKLLELEDVMLIPADTNSGNRQNEYNFSIQDELDKSLSLPLFTSPMPSIITESNWKVWFNNGIRPIIPRTSPLDIRLEAARFIFSAFSLKEVVENFITSRQSGGQDGFLRVCIDCGNGHDSEIFKVGSELKRIYGPKIITMAGNIGSPKVYSNYCKAMFDYVRVGMSSGSLVQSDKYGFYYPVASFLMDLITQRNTVCVGLKMTKIVVDGGVSGPAQILKCLALGADYVMLGREFVGLLESAGPLYERLSKENRYVLIPSDKLSGVTLGALSTGDIFRSYSGNTTSEIRSQQEGYDDIHDWLKARPNSYIDSRTEWVKVTSDIKTWSIRLHDVFSYGFTLGNATNWKEFKNGVKPVRVQ